MLTCDPNASALVDKYQTLVAESRPRRTGQIDWDRLHRNLETSADWTNAAATQLIMLARNYGSFMLRNALALSLAAEIEDGELGF